MACVEMNEERENSFNFGLIKGISSHYVVLVEPVYD